MKSFATLILSSILFSALSGCSSEHGTAGSKEPSDFTRDHQAEQRSALPFNDQRDFELVKKGLLKKPDELVIRNDAGDVVWELGGYAFLLSGEDHDSIHPSLQRQALLNMHYGLYQVSEGIYQVRGFDLANMSFVRSDNGWIVIDPLTVPDTSKAAYALVTEHFGELPIKAVIFSHSHADHFGGVRGIINQQQLDSGEVVLIAPSGFVEEAIKENVLAGNAMARRVTYQYGNVLPKGPRGQVDAAIGKGVALGSVGLLQPTLEITAATEQHTIDGVTMVFHNTPGTEAPAEMNTWFPQFKTLWMAENVIGSLHNLYTLRGAPVRDAQAWSKHINEALQQWGHQADAMFASHSWPRWGTDYIVEVLEKQRDLYGYLHDQSLHLANQGVTINEIHNELQVPEVLAHEWYNRGYHGTYSHNSRAVINKYLGYFDMNPASLDKLSPADAGSRYVEFMGGPDRLLKKARKSFERGEYRWVVEVVNHLVFADPGNEAARALQADALEQLGYQSEGAGWRNSYLAAAWELRHGVPDVQATDTAGPDIIQGMETSLLLDYLGVRLNAERADGQSLTINLVIPDKDEKHLIELRNAHLNNIEGYQSERADVTLTMNRADLNRVLLQATTLEQLVDAGKLQVEGDPQALRTLLGLLDDFEFWFNIVTP